MSNLEWKDAHEHKYHLTEAEQHQEDNDKRIAAALVGKLKPSDEEIIESLKVRS